jgi:hypothetical protein
LALVDERKKKKDEYMGFITVKCTLKPKTQEEKEQVGAHLNATKTNPLGVVRDCWKRKAWIRRRTCM